MRKGVLIGCVAGAVILFGGLLFFTYRMFTDDPFDDDFDYFDDLYEDDDTEERVHHDISKEAMV